MPLYRNFLDNLANLASVSSFGELFSLNPLFIVSLFGVFILCASALIIVWPPITERGKAGWFFLMLFSIAAPTVYIGADTLHMIFVSPTKGPVHWHADFQIYACGEKMAVKGSSGLSNKTGTPLIHTHNDERMHIEGTLSSLYEASPAGFFENIGGALIPGGFSVPTDEGVFSYADGTQCQGGFMGTLQVFVWRTENGVARQSKLADYSEPVAPYVQVPPGDCYIVEFGPEKIRTEHICPQYLIAEKRGDFKIED